LHLTQSVESSYCSPFPFSHSFSLPFFPFLPFPFNKSLDLFQGDRYKAIGGDLFNRFGGASQKIAVKRISLPDLSLPLQLGRRDRFSQFLPFHRKMAARLIEIFMGKLGYFTSYCDYKL